MDVREVRFFFCIFKVNGYEDINIKENKNFMILIFKSFVFVGEVVIGLM